MSLALRLLAVGTAVGLVGAWLTGRAMQAILFQVPPLPLSVVATTGAVLATVCLVACLVPSQRAARISPRAALAEE